MLDVALFKLVLEEAKQSKARKLSWLTKDQGEQFAKSFVN